ncbi:glycine betaine ABC transporter substrate-binding protein [Paenibacillus radicis (ex Xue et al. 2023)]|uniref:Glycine/betaine ABC transporter substrate-binding protein n=1 Tax=Paenibacillus radicis (ex Xue et al. 2023) TaxID=2972489 RepID=A0ABT1YKH2_9BACL|nr:glycine betaine ABC transporter substrate-binding protein [Paenibacillus radicis (ex Xue et al. 2023)]MCR8632475.1 glycine/betaine ABC transporter substrate-binding protein [Paenibacillus radicis (ex Xue et al. 2023)]
MKKWLILLVSLVLLLSACSQNKTSAGDAQSSAKIVVASKNFTEQYVLAQIMGQLLQNKTKHQVTIKEGGYAASAVLNQGMKDGDIQVFVDYTGTGYINVLKNTLKPDDTPDSVFQKTKEGYDKQFGFQWLEPLGMNNTFTLIMKEDKAKALNINSFSDLVAHSKDLVIGMDAAFYARTDGYKGLTDKYGMKFKDFKEMDISLAFSALADSKFDVLVAYATDGRIPALKLKSLKDDKGYFPPYFAAPIVPKTLIEKYPDVAQVLNQLAGKLDDKTMSELNAKVDMDKKPTAEVAKEFLTKSGLIK